MASKKRSEMSEEERQAARKADRAYYRTPKRQAYRVEYYEGHKGTPAQIRGNEKLKAQNQARRLRILKHYGTNGVPICVCCGDTTYEFLTIDHKHGGGTKHAKEVGYGMGMHLWIEKNNYPEDMFQVMCFNCNFAYGHYGYCPHQKARDINR